MNILSIIKLFFWNSKLKIQRGIEYRADFIIGTFISLGMSSIAPITQYLIFSQTRGYPGWTIHQIILFQGVLLMTIGLRDTAFGEMKQNVLTLVRRGDFDRLLLKPYPPISILLTSGFNLKSIGTIIAGIIVTTVAYANLNMTFNILHLPLLIICLISGMLLGMSLDIVFCSMVIKFVNLGQIIRLFDTIVNFASYPVEIYTKIPRVILSIIVPFAIFIYYPTQVLLNRIDFKLFLAFLASIVIYILCNYLWNNTLKNYTSAGG